MQQRPIATQCPGGFRKDTRQIYSVNSLRDHSQRDHRAPEPGQSNGASPHIPAAQALQNCTQDSNPRRSNQRSAARRLGEYRLKVGFDKRHNFLHIFSISVALLCFICLMLFMVEGLDLNIGLFLNTSMGFSEKFYLTKYKLEVTPADWTFSMSAFIYIWQLGWILYGVTSICRHTQYGYVYRVFPVLPPILYVVFCFALACNVSWLLIWDREYMEVALVFINLMTCNLYICLVASLRRLNEYGGIMVRMNMTKDIWIARILVHNGLAIFATWGTVASMFNFAVVLTYGTGAKLEVGSTVSLAIFTLEVIVWWVFDNFVFEKLLRYLFTPYIVIIISIAGILSKNWNPNASNFIFTLSLFGLVCVLTVVKTVLSIYRHYKRPIFAKENSYQRPTLSYEARHLLDT